MPILRCLTSLLLLLAAVSGTSRCPGHHRPQAGAPPGAELPDTPPDLPLGPSVAGTSHPLAVIGAPLEITGSGFSEATEVTLGGAAQPFVEVLDDTQLRIQPVAIGTPIGMQDLVIHSDTGTSPAYALRVLAVDPSRSLLAHGGWVDVQVQGLQPSDLVVRASLGGVGLPLEPTDITSAATHYLIPHTPDEVPEGPVGLVFEIDGMPSAPFPMTVTRILLNEVDVCQTSTDDGEFVEIATGLPGITLDGFVLVFWNGSSDTSYRVLDLAGSNVGPTNAEGYLVVGSEAIVGGAVAGRVLPNSAIQNGADAIGLYQGDIESYPKGESITDIGLIDALVYGTGDGPDAELLSVLLGSGPHAVQADEAAGASAETDSMARTSGERRDGRVFLSGLPTPGIENITR